MIESLPTINPSRPISDNDLIKIRWHRIPKDSPLYLFTDMRLDILFNSIYFLFNSNSLAHLYYFAMALQATWAAVAVEVLHYPFMRYICGVPPQHNKKSHDLYPNSAVVTPMNGDGDKIRFPIFLKVTIQARFYNLIFFHPIFPPSFSSHFSILFRFSI
jgi:hypothetical protein